MVYYKKMKGKIQQNGQKISDKMMVNNEKCIKLLDIKK
jgi:hypothetical protein